MVCGISGSHGGEMTVFWDVTVQDTDLKTANHKALTYPVHSLKLYFRMIYPNIIFPSTSRSLEWSLSFRFSEQNFVQMFHLSCVLHAQPTQNSLTLSLLQYYWLFIDLQHTFWFSSFSIFGYGNMFRH
jgi:hypothetical protein